MPGIILHIETTYILTYNRMRKSLSAADHMKNINAEQTSFQIIQVSRPFN